MKKFVFLLSLTLAAGCDSDDDLPLLPAPVAELPAPGELPTQVTVVEFNIRDEICPGVSPLNRNGILTHFWSPVTLYEVHADRVIIEGDVEVVWINNLLDTACESISTVLNAREAYARGPLQSDVIITPTPTYFGP